MDHNEETDLRNEVDWEPKEDKQCPNCGYGGCYMKTPWLDAMVYGYTNAEYELANLKFQLKKLQEENYNQRKIIKDLQAKYAQLVPQ